MQVKNELRAIKNLNEKVSEIIETITNDNGTAVKYSDGTMICRFILDLGVLNYTTEYGLSYLETYHIWAYPVSFINADNLIVNLTADLSGGIGGVTIIGSYLTASGVRFYPYSVKSASLGTKIHCTAIGRWK